MNSNAFAPETEVSDALHEGFYGTLNDFIAWIGKILSYGDICISAPKLDRFGREVIEIKAVAGGYSWDEKFLGKIRASLLGSFWVSTHRGGLWVYEIPTAQLRRRDEMPAQWLEPDRGLIERIHQVRAVILTTERGDDIDIASTEGVEIFYRNLNHEDGEPNGVIIIRPIATINPNKSFVSYSDHLEEI